MKIQGEDSNINYVSSVENKGISASGWEQYADKLDIRIKIILYALIDRLKELQQIQPPTEAVGEEIAKIMNQILQLEKEGYTDPNTKEKFIIDKDSAKLLDKIKKGLAKEMGIDVPTHPATWPVPTREQVGQWQNIGGLAQLLAKESEALWPGLANFIQYAYLVKVSDIVYTKMEKLTQALDVNKEALELLKKLLDLKGRVEPSEPTKEREIVLADGKKLKGTLDQLINKQFPFDKLTKEQFKEAYGLLAKALFTPIDGKPLIDPETFLEFEELMDKLAEAIKTLDPSNPLIKELDPDGKLLKSLKEIQAGLKDNDLPSWLLDGYGEGTKAGKFMRQISDAVLIAQGVNDSLKKDLQKSTFLYETFYKQAAEMLATLKEAIRAAIKGVAGQ